MKTPIFRYKIFEDDNLVLRYYSGTITLDDHIRFMNQTFNDPRIKSTTNIINDYRDADFSYFNPQNEISSFIDKVVNTKTFLGNKKVAFITNSPNQTIYSTLIESAKDDNMVLTKTFSTIINALYWVTLSTTLLQQIEQTIDQFSSLSSPE